MTLAARLFHLSDIHFGVEDRGALAWFEDAVAREKPDAVICTGDLTQRARKSEYAAAAQWFARLGVPAVIEPGNHDMPYFNPVERFRTPFRRFGRLAGMVGSELELEHVAVITLRTTVSAQWRWPWSDGVVRARALEEAVEELTRLKGDRRFKIVACHHPLSGPSLTGHNPTKRGHSALQVLVEAGADAVLSGHVHDAFDITHRIAGRELRMIGSGTMSERLRGTPPSYNVLHYDLVHGLSVENRQFGGQ